MIFINTKVTKIKKVSNLTAALIVAVLLAIVAVLGYSAEQSIINKNHRSDIIAVSLENSASDQVVLDKRIKFMDVETVKIDDDEETILSVTNPTSISFRPVYADLYELLVNDIEALRNADETVVKKYFGESDTFKSEVIADRVSATTINFLKYEELENGTNIYVHICTLDYPRMNSDFNDIKQSLLESNPDEADELAKRELAMNLLNDEYNICYNVVVPMVDGEMQIKEGFKQAITGGWYQGSGIELEPAKHIE